MKTFISTLLLIACSQTAWSQYRIYESSRNEINQTIIRTSEGGYLIGALQFCYTPEEWVIEGCPVGIRLIRTTETGDTLWTRVIPNFNVQGYVHVFENRDGTFSIFTSQDEIFTCQEWQIGPDFGLFQLLTYHISADGELISQSAFPTDCHLPLTTVTQLSDTTYVALATYLEPFASDTVEGRIYLLDQKGAVQKSVSVPDQSFFKADVVTDTLNRILVFFVNRDSVGVLQIYDHDLILLEQHTNSQFSSPCMTAEDTRGSMLMQENGSLTYMCDNPFGKGKNVELFVFNTGLDLLGHQLYEIPLSVGFTQDEDGELIILSETRNEEDSSNITLTYLSPLADSIETISLRIPGNQSPTQILAFEDEQFAVVGSHNCCNLHEDYGPGVSFLYLEDEFTSIPEEKHDFTMEFYPNPVKDVIYLKMKEGENVLHGQIYSSTGVLVKEVVAGDRSIRVNELQNGFYYMLIQTDDLKISRAYFVKMDH